MEHKEPNEQNCQEIARFSEEESAQLTQVFRTGSMPSDVSRQTRFKMLEKFIFSYRNSGVSADDPLLPYWLLHVAPSCVYPIMVDGRPSFHRCCFRDCAQPVNSQFALIRHYKEQHYHQIPQGIFGEIVYFPCKPCKVLYKRLDHLKSHQTSQTHKAIMARLGDRGCASDVSVYRQARTQHEEDKLVARERETHNEASAWYTYSLPTCTTPPSVSDTIQDVEYPEFKDEDDMDEDQLLVQAAVLFETLNKWA